MDSWINSEGVGFLEKIGIRPEHTVLDFGCKYGNYAIPAAKIVGKTGTVYALDKNNERLDILMEKARNLGLENIKTICTDGQLNIPLNDKTVDVVLLYDVIHLVGSNDSSTADDRKKLYREINRVMKNSGLVSVYPTHLTTHTDISTIEEVKNEFLQYFKFEEMISSRLIHDNNYVSGNILNFRKYGGV